MTTTVASAIGSGSPHLDKNLLGAPLAQHGRRRFSALAPIDNTNNQPAPSPVETVVETPQAPVEQALDKAFTDPPLTKVANFRDVGRNHNIDAAESNQASGFCRLKIGNLFRSARLDDATAGDVETLKNHYGIRTVIDLRSDLERKECVHVTSTFLFPAIEQEMACELSPRRSSRPLEDEIEYFDGNITPPEDMASVGSITPGGGQRHRYSIEFAGHKFRRQGVWKPLGVWQKCKVIALIGSGHKPRAVQMIGNEIISPKGLFGLYRNFADYCGDEIVQALKIMANAENFPVLVHCTQGKDRTGMVVAMALHCAGVDLAYILRDFERSQAGLDSQRAVMVAEMAKTGLGPEFSDAPATVLRDTISYIIDKFGSVDEYLERHGFHKDYRERVRHNLVARTGKL